ncbi:alpha/beta hydrolase family protein [Stieleria varia]|uniref:Alpha/beta hydrolase family protein n=1 Tax=Stieleria varia TaxID=2528005 RepID=A0A5C6ATH9_9BACT|nr:alpha/beta hydrolase [Stieleria varia]TWU02569.1 Alpha/beta hydrolase family protein [Stieleria varia]
MRDVADVHFPKLSWLVPQQKLNSKTQIQRYHGPLLLSHGDKDRTIPYQLGRQLYESANEPKQWVRIENAGHNDWLCEAYLRQLEGFVASIAK